MAAFDEAVTAMEQRAQALWPGIESAVAITFPNEPFSRPTDPNNNGAPLPFVRIELVWNQISDGSIGAPGYNLARRWGHIWIYAFVPTNTGAARAHQIVAEAVGMFENEDFGGVTCGFAAPGGEADDEAGNYYGQSASVSFYFDETSP